MSSYHMIDPELRPMVDSFPPLSWGPDTLAQAREFMEQIAETSPLPDLPVDIETVSLPRRGEEGEIGAILYRPKGVTGPLPVLLDIHGGGYVAGSPRIGAARNWALAHDLGCLILSVDYRLAPEAPYPAGLEDCYSALVWLKAEAARLSIDPDRIAVAGDSAGGGLAAALALLARDRGEVPLVAQILTYPMLDDRTASTVPVNPLAGEYMWDAPSNRFAWGAYLGTEPGNAPGPYAAPARAEDLGRLPPALIAVGQLDLFIAENIEYARRLIDAGVSTELHVYPGAFHGFDLVAESRSAAAYRSAVRDALRRAFRIA